MAARMPRRRFANPFVVTLAAIPACYVTSSPPPPQQPPVVAHGDHDESKPHTNPPPPRYKEPVVESSQPGTVVNPPRPTGTRVGQTGVTAPPPSGAQPGTTQPAQPTTQPASFDQKWTVTMSGNSCSAYVQVNCPKPEKGKPTMTCNPPPPFAYACPPELTAGGSLVIAQYAGQTECTTVPGPVKCPANTACNPPRPRKIACPTR